MTNYLLSLWLLLSLGGCARWPVGAPATFRQANERLARGDYAQAIRLYRQLEQQGVQRAELYCNAGNAFYKSGQVGWAIYYYEKGLALAPFDAQLLANRQAAWQQARLSQPLAKWPFGLRQTTIWQVADTGAKLAVISILISSIMLVISVLRKKGPYQENLLASSRYALLAGGLLLLPGVGVRLPFGPPEAIVIQAKATGRAGPSPAAKKTAAASAGEKVAVQNHYQNWVKIKTLSGEEAWVPAASLALLAR